MEQPKTQENNPQRPPALADATGSAVDPRVGTLTSEDAAMLKNLAEEMGALDCMPAWMRSEIEAKTKPPNDPTRPTMSCSAAGGKCEGIARWESPMGNPICDRHRITMDRLYRNTRGRCVPLLPPPNDKLTHGATP